MHRHQGMAPQSPALRTVVKQAHGVAASAAVTRRKPPAILGEGNLTRASGGPHGQQNGGVFMSWVFVVDVELRPLAPVHPGAARRLLTAGKAAIWRCYPFTLILKRAVATARFRMRVKIDPGSTTTGLALVDDEAGRVVWGGQIQHRGQRI